MSQTGQDFRGEVKVWLQMKSLQARKVYVHDGHPDPKNIPPKHQSHAPLWRQWNWGLFEESPIPNTTVPTIGVRIVRSKAWSLNRESRMAWHVQLRKTACYISSLCMLFLKYISDSLLSFPLFIDEVCFASYPFIPIPFDFRADGIDSRHSLVARCLCYTHRM